MPVLPTEELQQMLPVFNSKAGRYLLERFRRLLLIDKVSDAYDRCCHCSGGEFAGKILECLDIDYSVGGETDFLGEFAGKPFITVSNHPYGGIDGLIIADLFTRLNPDYKIIVNEFLSHVKAFMPACFVVNPNNGGRKKVTGTNILAIKKAMEHVCDGHPLGLFPSGAVSDLSLRNGDIHDREWQEGILRVIQRLEVPVIPVRFFDRNSSFFYLLGLISSKIRVLRMPGELFNKAGKPCRIGVGKPLYPERLAEFNDVREMGNFLRQEVYGMKMPGNFRKRSSIAAGGRLL